MNNAEEHLRRLVEHGLLGEGPLRHLGEGKGGSIPMDPRYTKGWSPRPGEFKTATEVALEEASMGFFDEYEKKEQERRDSGEGGSVFLSSSEKKVLIDEGVPFVVTAVENDPQNKFGPRYIVSVEIDGDARKAGFGKNSVFSRDRMLEYIQEMLEQGAEPPTMRLTLNGRSQVLEEVEA